MTLNDTHDLIETSHTSGGSEFRDRTPRADSLPPLMAPISDSSLPFTPSFGPVQSYTGDFMMLWSHLRQTLEEAFGHETFDAWLAPLRPVHADEKSLILAAPTAFFASHIQSKLMERIHAILKTATGTDVDVVLQVQPQFVSAFSDTKTPVTTTPVNLTIEKALEAPTPEWLSGTRLDSRYTFHHFVTGKSNSFAFTAAQSVAQALGSGTTAFNPFFIHGGVGLGKTHLMQAIGHHVLLQKPQTHILYLSAEQFLYKFVRALKDKNTLGFKDVFRSVDVLMIDDFQFIAGKDATQEEFFHTFNTLVGLGKQIILTADRPPHELPNLEDRLKSRLGSGLTVEVHAPEEETRLAILQAKAEKMGVDIPAQVLGLLAGHIASNVRELEGSLNRLIAYHRLTGEMLTEQLAREQLRDLFKAYNRTITIDDIQNKVAAQFHIRLADMHSPRRAREVARPRQVAMYLCKQLTQRSYPEIGRAFGGRDHTTVIHACETIESLLPRDSVLTEHVQILTAQLQGRR
jgi:chromosomal replication initiator protein